MQAAFDDVKTGDVPKITFKGANKWTTFNTWKQTRASSILS